MFKFDQSYKLKKREKQRRKPRGKASFALKKRTKKGGASKKSYSKPIVEDIVSLVMEADQRVNEGVIEASDQSF